jgi:hypothetical protein
MQRAVGVARARAGALRLRALHDGLEPRLAESEHLLGGLDDDAELVVVLTSRQAGSVRARTDLDEQDRVVG